MFKTTTDLTMADLLKKMRSSQIFCVCGLPDVTLRKVKAIDGRDAYQVGSRRFRAVNMEAKHYRGNEAAEQDKVPA
jgi:adenine-specific DNA-methyltransferase